MDSALIYNFDRGQSIQINIEGFYTMENNQKLEKLATNDVVSFTKIPLDKGSTLKVSQIIEEYQNQINHRYKAEILFEGIECEVLRVNEGKWRKGKLKLILEFEPNEPEIKIEMNRSNDSLLDDIRQAID